MCGPDPVRQAGERLDPGDPSGRHGPQLDPDRSFQVRAADRCSGGLQGSDRFRRRVPVVVVGPDGHDADRRPDGSKELRQRRRRPVVGHLEEVGRQLLGTFQQVGLAFLLDVAGQQDPSSAPPHDHDDRHLVGLGIGGAIRPPGRGAQHVDGQPADDRPVAGFRLVHRDAPLGGEHRQLVRRRCHLRQRPPPDRAHGNPLDHRGQPAHVIGVRVRHDHQVQVPPAIGAQPLERTLVLPGVNQDRDARHLHQDGITLSHVDRGHGEGANGRPNAPGTTEAARDRNNGGEPQPAPRNPGPGPGDEPGAQAGYRHQGHAHAQRRTTALQCPRGPEHDAQRRSREPEQGLANEGHDQPETRARQRERRRHRRGRNGDHVGGNRDEWHVIGRQQQHRGDRQLRADRGREQHGQGRGQPREAPRDQRCHDQQPCGGRDRQQESQRAGEEWVDQDQQQGRGGERVEWLGAEPSRLGRQDDARHHGGTEDAGLEPGQKGEPGQHGHEEDPPSGTSHPERAGEDHRTGQDDRHVGAADSRQVGQAGREHCLLAAFRQQ